MSSNRLTSAQQIADLSSLVERLTARLSELENRPVQSTSSAPDLSNLATRITQLESSMQASPVGSVPSSLSGTHEKIKVALPDKFDGNCLNYETFKAALDNFFALKASVYTQDEIKVRTIGTLLSKQALQWYSTLVKGQSPLLKDYNAFMNEFQRLFSDPNAKMKSQLLLKKLKQGSSSVLSYFTRFRALAINTGFDQEAQMDSFRTGLSDEIKDVLATSLEEIPDLEKLVSMAIKIDTRLFDRKMEKESKVRPPHAAAVTKSTPDVPAATPTAASASSAPKTTQQSGKITQEERQRRLKLDLCLYCGNPGHKLEQCLKRKASKRPSGASAAAVAGDPQGSQQ
jgi:hypothetical protein